ncbi:unnamed protein product [Ectocarpus sp. 4 AP-2014]
MTEIEIDFRASTGTSINSASTEASGHVVIPAFVPLPLP